MQSRPSPPPPFQPSLTLDGLRFVVLAPTERAEAVALLATLLLEASGVAMPEGDDDEHA